MPVVLVVSQSEHRRAEIIRRLQELDQLTVVEAVGFPDAVATSQSDTPDIIVTEADLGDTTGMQLVQQVKEDHPSLPVIVVADERTEGMAIEALSGGAAGYVPHRMLDMFLNSSVQTALNASNFSRLRRRMLAAMIENQTAYSLENDQSLFPILIQHLQEQMLQFGICGKSDAVRIGIALEEALSNALFHGNLELDSSLRAGHPKAYLSEAKRRLAMSPYAQRHIEVIAEFTHEHVKFVIRDEGKGFDPSGVPDPTDPANLTKVSGRGIMLIRAFMDQVSYDKTGKEISLTKRRATVPACAA